MKRSGFRRKSYEEVIASKRAKSARSKKLKGKVRKVVKVTILKKKLDEIFSKYIRRKYSKDGKVQCYTCGVTKDIKEIQNGHFISRSYLATRFVEDNCRPQCVGCNVFGGGKPVQFASKLSEEKGAEIVSSLYRKAQEITKDFPYQEKIDYYTLALEQLENL